MFRFNKTRNLKSWKSFFLIAGLSLCFSLFLLANIIDPPDKEIAKNNDDALPLISQKQEIKPEPKLESRADDIDINKDQAADKSVNQTVDQSANRAVEQPVNQAVNQSVTQAVDQSANQAVNQEQEIEVSKVSRSAPVRTSEKIQLVKDPAANVPEVKAETPDAAGNESSHEESYSAAELDLLARLIHAEAQGEPYEAKVAVGAVVLNRIGPFADSIENVIYQNIDGYYQFTPVENGWINKPAGEDSIKAAKEALGGVDPTNGALFYYDNQTTNEWIMAKPVSVTFGNMIYAY